MRKKKIDRTNISNHLLEYQLNMVGKKMIDLLDDDEWYFNWTLTSQQKEEFRKYALPLLQKVFKFNRNKAKQVFEWFYTQFGLRISNTKRKCMECGNDITDTRYQLICAECRRQDK